MSTVGSDRVAHSPRSSIGTTDPNPQSDRAYCHQTLPRVSRTFAVCIRLLPAPLDHSVRVAYLLCRIADTIEDRPDLSGRDKQHLLDHFARCLNEADASVAPLRSAFAEPRSDEEHLVARADGVLREYRRLETRDQDAIRPWVREMCQGMAEFAVRRGEGDSGHLTALASLADLDRYCYYVAGTVGHLLTALFRIHDRRALDDRYARLDSLATSFGLGLQLTNIIKDVSEDRKRGWVFVPRQLCVIAGIQPEQLADGPRDRESRQAMDILITKARHHLADALEYCTGLPRLGYGVRLFCLTSLYFAVRTLRLAAGDANLLTPGHKVKITRREVYRTIGMTRLVAPSNTLVRAYFKYLEG